MTSPKTMSEDADRFARTIAHAPLRTVSNEMPRLESDPRGTMGFLIVLMLEDN
jgi:hypothetical protein